MTDRPRTLIVGGGVAALEAMLALRELAGARPAISVLSARPDFVFRPLSVGEPFGRGRTYRFELQALTALRDSECRIASMVAVDPTDHEVETSGGERIPYDSLIVATGAMTREALPGALTFWAEEDGGRFRDLLDEIERGPSGEIVFAVPPNCGWPLPLYELALLTARHLRDRGVDARLSLATPEAEPLELFGRPAAEAVSELLEEAGIRVRASLEPRRVTGEGLELASGHALRGDRVVTLPAQEGPGFPGLPSDELGFVRVDGRCRAQGLDDVYAAGDVTDFPVKQGGIAAQQADVAATAIARAIGVTTDEPSFRPVLRGMLLTGDAKTYMTSEGLGGGRTSSASPSPLWWPSSKLAARYLGPFLAAVSERGLDREPPAGVKKRPVEVDLSAGRPAR